MCMPIRSRFLSARLYNYILNASSLQLFIHCINTLSTGSVKVFQIERCYADCPIHQCKIGQKFSWISRILPSYSFLLGVALTAQDVVAAPGHGLMASWHVSSRQHLCCVFNARSWLIVSIRSYSQVSRPQLTCIRSWGQCVQCQHAGARA
jgi:hypothetical protein